MPRKFTFRLEPVLELREGEETKAKEALAETISLRSQSREMLESAENLVDEAAEAMRRSKGQSTTIADLAAQQLWRERLERHRLSAGQQLELAEGEVVLSRNALVNAHQRRAALDKLKDIKKAEHTSRMDRFEAAEADEIALRQHHGRKRRQP